MQAGIKHMGRTIRRHLEIGWFGLLALLIMGPMLRSGFVLTFDLVFTPNLPAPHTLSNTYVFEWALHLLSMVLGGQVIEKLLIFSILLLCGLGMYRLVEAQNEVARYFAGIFYTVNPFTYERWMAGQYYVLAGYTLLPFLVKALVRLYSLPNRRAVLRVALWYMAIASISIHSIVLAAIISCVLFAVYMLAHSPPSRYYYRDMLRSASLAVAGAVMLNSYWLFGVITGSSLISQTIKSINSVDLQAFTTASHAHVGLFANVASLYGFWLERYHRYAMPNHIAAVWAIGSLLLAVLIIIGILQQSRQQSLLAVSLGLAGLVGLFVAIGTQAAVTGPVTNWLILHLPFMKGFREPEKFSALLALAYAYFAAHGLDSLVRHLPAKAEGRRELVRDGALLLPLLYVATMPLGFANQLKPVNYPTSWYSFNQQLQNRPPTGKLLFLPWHQYMSYDFSKRIIANPAPNFFAAPVIAGTNAEYGGLDDPAPTSTSRFISQQILKHTADTNLGAKLATRQIQYVLLANGYDVKKYDWLKNQSDLRLVSRQPSLTVYVNKAYHDR